ncbi:hypothetical protein G9A89_003307 [Geosiphon pyriformis]|nr:hypothetical protein G9A89_003307 [Geosiphon pyriformis]
MYSDVESLSGNNVDIGISGVSNSSILDSAANTSKVKCVNTGADFGSSLGSPNYDIEDDIEKTVLLAKENVITVNTNLKRQGIHSNQAVVIRKILMNIPKKMIITTTAEFREIKSIKSFLIGKDSVCMAKAMGDQKIWTSKDWYKALLFILPMSIMTYDLGNLLEGAGKKTCLINYLLKTGNKTCCTVVCFKSNEALEFAFSIEPILSGVRLFWARIDLVWCKKYERCSHSALECDTPIASTSKPLRTFKKIAFNKCYLQLAKLYEKKNVSISCSAAFGGKSWAQVVLLSGCSDSFHSISGSGSPFYNDSGSNNGFFPVSASNLSLGAHLAFLECFLKLLADQVSSMLKKLSSVKLVLLTLLFCVPSLAISTPLMSHLDMDMTLNNVLMLSAPLFSAVVSNISEEVWKKFGNLSLAAALTAANDFKYYKNEGDINEIDGGLVKSAVSSKFHKLELLVAKILKAYKSKNLRKFQALVNKWVDLDFDQAIEFKRSLDNGCNKVMVKQLLAYFRKLYRSCKFLNSKTTENFQIRAVIAKCIEAFVNNKSQIIRSVLEKPFRKVMLDYLINNSDLVLKPDLVKDKVNSIIENWTRKHTVKSSVPSYWQRQFAPLNYVNNSAFSGMIEHIDFNEFLSVIKNLPDGKAAGLSGISNEI